MQRVPLFAQGYYRTPDIHFDPTTGRGKPFHYFAYGAAVSEVEVDGFTGAYRLLRTDILQDVGDSISPIVDRGQIEGGFIQGVGWLTLEELLWDDQGRAGDRAAPPPTSCRRGRRCPTSSTSTSCERATQPGVVFGSKAVGEPPLMLAISVREALRDAVAAFGGRATAESVVTFDSPATPERVFFAVQRARRAAAPSAVARSSTRAMTLAELNAARSRRVRRRRSAGSSSTRPGWPSAPGRSGRSRRVDDLHRRWSTAVAAADARRAAGAAARASRISAPARA